MSMNMYTVAGDCPSNEELALGYRQGIRMPQSCSSHRTKGTSQNWL